MQYDVLWSTSYRTQWSAIIVNYYIYNFLLYRISMYIVNPYFIIWRSKSWYYKRTAFSWGCYSRLPHEGKHITLWKKNITRDEVFFQSVIFFSRVWSSTITPSTKGSMFFLLYWMPVVKRTLNLYRSQLTNGTHYVHITTQLKQQLPSFQQVIFS